MDINNIALVRATDVIPLDGVLKSISNSQYLCKHNGTDFSGLMSRLLREAGIAPREDYTRAYEDGYFEEYVKEVNKVVKEYLPYSSDYNSMVLFSLNGLCPDDNEHGFANNTFSNKKCVVIEPLTHHIDDVISLVPTDTAILGDVHLSSEATILIEKNTYLNLTYEEKLRLQNTNLSVKTFIGNLKDVVCTELKNSNKYIPETLSLTRRDGGYRPSPTCDMQKETIKNIAAEHNIAQVLFFNVLTGQNDEVDKLSKVENELENREIVKDYYTIKFYEELLSVMNAPQELIETLAIYFRTERFIDKLGELIKNFGFDNYKSFLDNYNSQLLIEQKQGLLKTPQEIVNEKKKSYDK